MTNLSSPRLLQLLTAATGGKPEPSEWAPKPVIMQVPKLGRVRAYLWTVTPDMSEDGRPWDEHKAQVERNLSAAMRNGTVQKGAAQRMVREARASKNITIRMPLADLERARRLSATKGLAYQTYVKMLLHEALDLEEKRGAA